MTPAQSTLVLGGARSGKSRRAQALAEALGDRRIFVATAEAFDEEMSDRIARHREERGEGWQTIECPLDLVNAILHASQEGNVCVVDCLTVWLSNLYHYDHDTETATKSLCEAIRNSAIPTILVSNEVGLGLVPENPLGRSFRDAQGRLNQEIAAVCDTVELMAAGLSLKLKG